MTLTLSVGTCHALDIEGQHDELNVEEWRGSILGPQTEHMETVNVGTRGSVHRGFQG